MAASSYAVKIVNDKVNSKANINHDHNDKYYQKSEIDNSMSNLESVIANEQYKIKVDQGDQADYLRNKVDNVTLTIDGNELKVKSVDGLVIGVVNLNSWLSGTSRNLQDQIDDINNLLVSMTSGMNFLGKVESYSDMQSITTMTNGSVVVVLEDESRSNGRSLYVYSDNLSMWDFVGAFEFSDSFTALTDTPSAYTGQDGKVLKADETNSKLVFEDVTWDDVQNRPDRTKTQIETAVDRAHEHANKTSLDRIIIDEQRNIKIDGAPYEPAGLAPKQRLYATRTSTITLSTGMTIVFDNQVSGDIPYNTSTGKFTLEAGKTYRILVAGAGAVGSTYSFRLDIADANNNPASPNSGLWGRTGTGLGAGPLVSHITPETTQEYRVRVHTASGSPSFYSVYATLEIVEI